MPRRVTNSKPVSLIEMPDVTPGKWVYVPGDSGDSSVGLQGYAPTVSVAQPDDEDSFVELCEIREPIYSVLPARTPDGEFDLDTGERYLPGSPDRNGLLMAGSKGLLEASQTVLKELLYEQQTLRQESPQPNSESLYFQERMAILQRQIATLEQAIRDSIIFSE